MLSFTFSKEENISKEPVWEYSQLNEEQKQYLQKKKELKLCIDPNWMPLDKIEEGIHEGIGADIMEEISRILKISIRLIPTKQWKESLLKIQRKECDILSLTQETPDRKKYLNFTTPYISTPIVVATKIGIPFVDNLNSIKNRRLGIVENYSMQELLSAKYPNINLVGVSSIQEGLALVQQEKIFGFIDNSIVINHEIQRQHIKDVTITGQFQDTFHLSIASIKDEPILDEILELALLSIPMSKRNEIVNKWSHISYKTQLDYVLIAQIGFFGFALISIFIYWNLQLKEEIKKKEKAKKLLKQSEERFRTLFDIAPVFINSFDKEGNVKLWNKECERVFGWSFEELEKIENPINLFYPDINEKKLFIKMITSEKSDIFKEWTPKIKNGNTIITRWANVFLSNNEVIHIGYDITKERQNAFEMEKKTEELKVAKQQLEELNNSLEKKVEIEVKRNAKNQLLLLEKNKLAQMGEMIENISHQWRQPLSEINSLVLLLDQELMQKNIFDNNIEEKLNSIETLTSHMSNTIDNFKNFFNSDKKAQIFSLYKIIDNTLLINKGNFEYNYINIEVDAKKSFKCNSHPRDLQEVLLIILNNAADALIHHKIYEPKIYIKIVEESNSYVISVKDNAKGIPKKFLDKIFEPYFSTKYKKQGTGIGLYMAKTIVEESLKGRLEVENMPEGACFTIIIPKGEICANNK